MTKQSQFTYNYSKTNAVFLDVKLFKSKVGTLHTSVFEKIIMCSTIMNSHPVIHFHAKGILFCQAKRYRRITSDDDCFKQDLSRLETYFKRSNYPVDILTEALPRASNLTIEEALQSSSSERNNQDVITFVCTYNPSLPNIG